MFQQIIKQTFKSLFLTLLAYKNLVPVSIDDFHIPTHRHANQDTYVQSKPKFFFFVNTYLSIHTCVTKKINDKSRIPSYLIPNALCLLYFMRSGFKFSSTIKTWGILTTKLTKQKQYFYFFFFFCFLVLLTFLRRKLNNNNILIIIIN
ncbi:predicted protein [Candida tropicalis MYA-3404]|uniref:Uncharacterized protein n=1 Tax=Candida tropicalis (strain ATCC MYA-3404 / T1) TaxID=294747 RepID=C5MII0_CANTT|nr:predicted protein [Candida tropicalis MYA-3404]EER30474.1 predicted protein [Candida tropicalis MYA-3404]KAG4406337.1 hypothetical protein JTP64_003721 [Candida tropicalis]